MASIADLCWANSQDLLREVDLHALYVLQFKAIGAAHYRNYPYHLLVHTGKITIGINLGQKSDVPLEQTFFQKRKPKYEQSTLAIPTKSRLPSVIPTADLARLLLFQGYKPVSYRDQ